MIDIFICYVIICLYTLYKEKTLKTIFIRNISVIVLVMMIY